MLEMLLGLIKSKKKVSRVETFVLSLSEFEFPITIKKRKTNYVRLKVALKTGEVSVSVPKSFTKAKIKAFLLEKEDWIRKAKSQVAIESKASHEYVDGENLLIFGINVRLVLKKGKQNNFFYSEELSNLTITLKNIDDLKARSLLVKKAYKAILSEYLLVRVRELSATSGLTYKKLTVKSMSRSWGRFRKPEYEVVMALRLIHRSKAEIDYVIFHELCHSVYMNHGPEFKALLKNVCPNYKELEAKLRVDTNPYLEDA